MKIETKVLFLSLFDKETSGTVCLELLGYKLEVDVKHSVYDYGIRKFFLHFPKETKTLKMLMWLPIRFGCQGLNIKFFKTRYKNETIS